MPRISTVFNKMEPTPAAKKPRKANFSACETLTLIEEFKNNREILQSKLQASLSNKNKHPLNLYFSQGVPSEFHPILIEHWKKCPF